ncbi:hypothetical protein AGOR_G00127210 [Albula goreensis]|uniref:PDZ domain-containing protein n=1 Tax=Albula goreensis TaxID=1534307 RepID=A0A8T3DCD7_9TELE|nr:hypothetical protein AGOR_G00127210 [Albula goreensis]
MEQTTGVENAMVLTQRFTFNPKEGIDNPALVIADDTGGEFWVLPANGEGPAWSCDQEVEPWSVAERSGLRDGDRLLEVNEEFVDDVEHHKVVQRIQACGLQLCFLVLGGEEYEEAVREGQDLRSLARAHRGEDCSRPQLYHIPRDPTAGFGFNIIPVEGERGRYSVCTLSDGPAERAGLCSGQRLVWINGAMVSELTHSALIKMLRKSMDHVTVLVIDHKSEVSYNRRRLPILPTMAEAHNLPLPEKLHLVRGSGGFGFLLRQEKLPSGCIAHLLREVDTGSPAEQAGMQDGDLLLEINGEAVEELEHEEIVSRVRQSNQMVTFTVIHAYGRDLYMQLHLSPMIFHDSKLPKEAQRKLENVLTAPPIELPKKVQVTPPCVRLCVLNKGPTGFGFRLSSVQHELGTFIAQVEKGGSAEKAGLWEGM